MSTPARITIRKKLSDSVEIEVSAESAEQALKMVLETERAVANVRPITGYPQIDAAAVQAAHAAAARQSSATGEKLSRGSSAPAGGGPPPPPSSPKGQASGG